MPRTRTSREREHAEIGVPARAVLTIVASFWPWFQATVGRACYWTRLWI